MTLFEALEKCIVVSQHVIEVPVAKTESMLFRSLEVGMKRIGGKWNTKTKSFAFSGPNSKEELQTLLQNLKDQLKDETFNGSAQVESPAKKEKPTFKVAEDIDHENIPTPFDVARKMAELLGYMSISKETEDSGNLWILEPCAGTGIIIKALLGLYGGAEGKGGGARIAYGDVSKKAIETYIGPLDDLHPDNLMNTEIESVYDYLTEELGGKPGQNCITPRQYIITHPPHSKAIQVVYHLFKLLKEGGRLVVCIANHYDFESEGGQFNTWLEEAPEYSKRTVIFSAENGVSYSILVIDK